MYDSPPSPRLSNDTKKRARQEYNNNKEKKIREGMAWLFPVLQERNYRLINSPGGHLCNVSARFCGKWFPLEPNI